METGSASIKSHLEHLLGDGDVTSEEVMESISFASENV